MDRNIVIPGAGKAAAGTWLAKPDGSPTVANMVMQVAAGIAISLVIYWVSLLVMRTDKLVIDQRLTATFPTEVPIFNGYVDAASYSNKVFNTMNDASGSFLALPRSVNRKGGAQFTYSVWLYMGDVSDSNIKNKVLFTRGSMQPYKYVRAHPGAAINVRDAADLYVRCPMVRFGKDYREFVVEFNTADDPDTRVVMSSVRDNTDSALRRNMASLTANYWVMATFVFEDNMPINDFESGIVVRFYLNDTLFQVSRVRGTLRQNNGALHVLPLRQGEMPMQGVRLANFSYFNYAMGDEDVRARYMRGPSKSAHSDPASRFGVPLYLSAANKAEITNM